MLETATKVIISLPSASRLYFTAYSSFIFVSPSCLPQAFLDHSAFHFMPYPTA